MRCRSKHLPSRRSRLGPVFAQCRTIARSDSSPRLRKIPDGFAPIFNGKDLTGWHISKEARHGVHAGLPRGARDDSRHAKPLGSGGLLITDRKYRDFELYLEVKPDWGCDSGVFFRTTETGVAYQVTMDYLPGGSMGRTIGEGGFQVGPARPAAATPAAPQAAPPPPATPGESTDAGMKAWKPFDWNTVRIRVEGDVPHTTVWINGVQISDATDTENHALGGMIEGPIAIQIHGGRVRWQPGGFWRWRNIGIRELK